MKPKKQKMRGEDFDRCGENRHQTPVRRSRKRTGPYDVQLQRSTITARYPPVSITRNANCCRSSVSDHDAFSPRQCLISQQELLASFRPLQQHTRAQAVCSLRARSPLCHLWAAVRMLEGTDALSMTAIYKLTFKAFLLFENVDRTTWAPILSESRSAYNTLCTHYLRAIEHPDEVETSVDPLSDNQQVRPSASLQAVYQHRAGPDNVTKPFP